MVQSNQYPELKVYMNKRLSVKMNGKRHVEGTMIGFDPFMNITLENAYDLTGFSKGEANTNEKTHLGTVVVRGNSIEMMECLDPVYFRQK
ncbi:predicted protein [Naegleria gruberi]|uniref:Small nuclear ribonucleoprotein G n=1 Tax=Naegleria gruberi TaxID=5762 RepID=D2UXW3_NAEGR|nr:uncharacterized protein NAEGRDRAFT_28898 [Naegleria gruberi]EFC50698.1 predicted protein [Naegleria gruberi]|eukprot:XP_002683442.1 predicted protein [Naegleria gruberi strain NEG-M]